MQLEKLRLRKTKLQVRLTFPQITQPRITLFTLAPNWFAMTTLFFPLLIAIILLEFVASTTVPFWPIPQSYSIGTGDSLQINQAFDFQLIDQGTDENSILANAFDRYKTLIGASHSAAGTLKTCTIQRTSTTLPKLVGADETYELNIDSSGNCSISAVNAWGVLRALETFTQVLLRDSSSNVVSIANSPIYVKDTNRYGHRGLLIDTARHYISVPMIYKVIDSLPMSK